MNDDSGGGSKSSDISNKGGGVNLFNKSEPAHEGASKYQSPVDGAFAVMGHGSSVRMDDNRKAIGKNKIYAEELADLIKASGWTAGQTIDIVACHVGLDSNDSGISLGQDISNLLSTGVRAPDNYVFWWNNGDAKTFGKIPGNGPRGWLPNYDAPGQWRNFSPQGGGR